MVVQTLIGWLNPQRLVRLAFHVQPASEFILFGEQRLTRGQVYAGIQALAAGLQSLGVVKGDRIASVLPGCPEAVYASFLPATIGTVHVPLNPLLGEHELRHILADCGATVVIVTRNWLGQNHPAIMARLLPALPLLRHVLVRDAQDGDDGVFRPLAEVMAPGRPVQPVRVTTRDPALLSYTSGTTGQPKGVLHTLGRSWGLMGRLASLRLKRSPLRCLLLPFPPFHFPSLFGIRAALLAGGKVILMERFDPQEILKIIERERVSQIGGTPTMYRWLLKTPGQEQYDLSSVQRLTSSSEPISPDLAQALHERFGCPVENFYGTAETMMISWTTLDDSWERAANTVGKPVPGVQVRIVDDARQPLPTGTRGEIAVQTSQMMTGYYNDPALTAQALDEEGWYYTGDIGYLGDDGYLRLVDRKKDLIIRGGENVYPAEVEQYLGQHPFIRRAAVIGVPGALGSEEVCAYLELQPGARLTVTDVLEFCRGRIAAFKIPDHVRFSAQLPVTATGKVQKYKLRALAAQEAEPGSPS